MTSDWLPRHEQWLGEPWPSSAHRAADGELTVGGVDAVDIAAEFGTPAYVLDETDFRERARAYKKAFTDAFAEIGADVHLYYAGKALLTRAVARWAMEEGLFIDTASAGELYVALKADVPGARIGLHGNNKSTSELDLALKNGVGQIIVDSLTEIDRLAERASGHGVIAPVMVRVTTGVHAGGHEYISTAHEDQKFGLSIHAHPGEQDSPAMQALERVLSYPSLKLIGIHSHIGSQILDHGGFAEAAREVLKLRAELAKRTGYLVDEIDLGGGYGIAYLPTDQSMDPRAVARQIAAAVQAACTELGTPVPRVSVEPGRSIVGPAGVTIYLVGTVKPVTATDADGNKFTRLYVAVDGGMGDNIRPALYQAEYHAVLANRDSKAAPVTARIVGKHCESGDILVRQVELPGDIQRGDLLAVAATGAYGRAMASNYNMLPRPPIVAVASGEPKVIVRRETVKDLLDLDMG